MSKDAMIARVKARMAGGGGKKALAVLSSSTVSAPKPSGVVPTQVSPPKQGTQCLLLDVSGSMAEECEPGRSKWDALRALLPQFAFVPMFSFSDHCAKTGPGRLPHPGGGTDMAGAFLSVKASGMRHVILITDGLPNDEAAALTAARGLKIDVFYVGPHPRPAFLDHLAGSSGGKSQTASLKTGARQLAFGVKQTLAALTDGGRG